MTIETALYPTQLNATLPPQSDIVREGAGHLRLLKTVVKTTFPNLGGAWNATQTEANYIVGVTSPIQAQINSKGAIAGQTWTGAHVFSGSAAVPTLAQGTNTTDAASTAFVQAEWATRLPNYTTPITANSTELNRLVGVTSGVQSQINAKGAISGQAWTGAHSFTGGSITVPTQSAGDSSTNAASTAFVAAASFAAALPGQTGNSGKYVKTDGTAASWSFITFAELTSKPSTLSGYGITDGVATSGDQTIAGNKSYSGNLLATGGVLGYGVGAGGTVVQATSKTTAVTLNKPSGLIAMNNAALAAGAVAAFQLNNSFIGVNDLVVVQPTGGGAGNEYQAWVSYRAAGLCIINVRNNSAGSRSEAIPIQFNVFPGATS